jgi:adenylate kinase
MAGYYVLLGPPGAGKGTQAAIIAERCGIPHISSGNLFRDNLQNDTPLGVKAREFMQKGELVPDDVTIAMVEERLTCPDCQNGALLDGFPRTAEQAEALDLFLERLGRAITKVPFIYVDSEELLERLSGRWICREQGHTYHMRYNPPKNEKICDVDGSELYQREDDALETVKQRIRVYEEQTAPLIDYYQKKGLLVQINGTKSIKEVTSLLLAAIKC